MLSFDRCQCLLIEDLKNASDINNVISTRHQSLVQLFAKPNETVTMSRTRNIYLDMVIQARSQVTNLGVVHDLKKNSKGIDYDIWNEATTS